MGQVKGIIKLLVAFYIVANSQAIQKCFELPEPTTTRPVAGALVPLVSLPGSPPITTVTLRQRVDLFIDDVKKVFCITEIPDSPDKIAKIKVPETTEKYQEIKALNTTQEELKGFTDRLQKAIEDEISRCSRKRRQLENLQATLAEQLEAIKTLQRDLNDIYSVLSTTLRQIQAVHCGICPTEFHEKVKKFKEYARVKAAINSGQSVENDEFPPEMDPKEADPRNIQEDYRDSCITCYEDTYNANIANAEKLICVDCRAQAGVSDPSAAVTEAEVETMLTVENCNTCAVYLFPRTNTCESEFCKKLNQVFKDLQYVSQVFTYNPNTPEFHYHRDEYIDKFVKYREEFYKLRDTGLADYCVCNQPNTEFYYKKNFPYLDDQPGVSSSTAPQPDLSAGGGF